MDTKRTRQLSFPPDIEISSHIQPADVRSYTLDEGIGRFPHYRSMVTDRGTLEKLAASPDANLVLAISHTGHILGYTGYSYPDPIEGWDDNTDGLCFELCAIEVSRCWRRRGIARAMIDALVRDPLIEKKILFLTAYAWHFDVEQTRLTENGYRNMLVRLFKPFGFDVYPTRRTEITMFPANMIMARAGEKVMPKQRERFQAMLYPSDR